ncbi:2TM domain-containing protein [Aquimarina sp. 2201CG14-23]|uniref:2TM domain-containing protein n=1 Tax=Aquimarina mycalae TaxID=3040073 RepID=UPI002477D528|nr:2TM domain-containing protein [Aquimarina sp. 2201CG14-23]MDH7447091.1 2TM domain-containing protein [Aquimarina sp. 2201CG14-23]
MNIFKEIGKGILIGTGIFIAFLIVYYFKGIEINFDIELLHEYLENVVFSIIIYVANVYLFLFRRKKHQENLYTVKNLTVTIILATIVSVVAIFVARLFYNVFVYEKSLVQFLNNERPQYYLVSLSIATVLTFMFYGIFYWKHRQESKVTEQKIIAGTASAKFAALKNQLDPHFLFNSLNVLTSLIDENPRMAQKFTTSLSKVYRYVLEQKDKELITIDEELKFAKTYMTLLKLRFEDSIIFEMPDQASNPEAKVVPLSLQILLENTIKHNVVMPDRPLHIKIYENDGFLIVENNLQPKEVIKQSSGVGLGNVKQRYGLLTKKEFSVFKTETAFIAKLPILTKRITSIDMTTSQNIQIVKDLKYKRAKERVKKMKEFYGSLVAYCIVIPFLIFINYRTTGFNLPWVIFPIAGWGLGLIFHYAEAFDHHPIFGKDWEKKKIRKYMDESNKRNYE